MILPSDPRDATPPRSSAITITPLVRAVVIHCLDEDVADRGLTSDLKRAVEQDTGWRWIEVVRAVLGGPA